MGWCEVAMNVGWGSGGRNACTGNDTEWRWWVGGDEWGTWEAGRGRNYSTSA